MNTLLKAFSALLGYPGPELRAALPEIAGVIGRDRALPAAAKDGLAELIGEMAASDPYDLEEAYVALFDRGRATSLHLFEHVHGESRDRGQAMVSLQEVYVEGGYELAPGELPDYLPALLEYLSLAPAGQVADMLADCAHILRATGEALASRGSRYSAVFAALLDIAGEDGLDPKRAAMPPRPEKPLDEDWQEQPVIFGQEAACDSTGCGMQHTCATPSAQVPRVFQN